MSQQQQKGAYLGPHFLGSEGARRRRCYAIMILSFIVGVTFSRRMKKTAASLTDGKKIISILALQFEDQPLEQVQRWLKEEELCYS